MNVREIQLPERHKVIVNQLVAACQADERVVAAFLSGSYAKGTADGHSDLDFGLILADEAYTDFIASWEAFIQRLGEPVFLKEYHGGGTDMVFFVLSDGTEGEIVSGRKSNFTHIHIGPYRVLLDKTGCLAEALFAGHQPTQTEQIETLCDLIDWFWHDLLHHFITPMARGQLWGAYGALEELRRTCVNLARLNENFQAEAEGYEKVEQALPIEQLAPLQASFCPMERGAMLQSASIIVRFYQALAPSLARTHGIVYPAEMAHMVAGRLEQLSHASLR